MHVHMYTAVVILDVGKESRLQPDQELIANQWSGHETSLTTVVITLYYFERLP